MLNLKAESVRLAVRRNRLSDMRQDIFHKEDGTIAVCQRATKVNIARCAALQRRICRTGVSSWSVKY